MKLKPISASEYVVMSNILALAKNGISNPPKETLSYLTGISKRHIRHIIKSLESKEYIKVHYTSVRGKGNFYELNETVRNAYFNS